MNPLRHLLAALVLGLGFSLTAAEGAPKTEGVEVKLISDGATWVQIKPADNPGEAKGLLPVQLTSRTVVLPPGDYEVIGRRKSYQDVKQVLSFRKGSAPVTLQVICTEAAR